MFLHFLIIIRIVYKHEDIQENNFELREVLERFRRMQMLRNCQKHKLS